MATRAPATAAAAASLSLSFSSVDSPRPPIFLKSPHPSSFITPTRSLSLSCPTSLSKTRTFKSSSHSSSPSSSNSISDDPFPTTQFLTPDDAKKKETLRSFQYWETLADGGSVMVRPIHEVDIEATIRLLTESFAEAMSIPSRLLALLNFLVKQYVKERRALLPHAVMLVAFVGGPNVEEVLAGTVEISFNAQGANVSPPAPVPPAEHPYLCNMAVKKDYRRGIGKHLLKASEYLICQMTDSREVYLHCRIIDKVPLRMYLKAGYEVIKTDSIFILLTFQRRKHLMRKKLPEPEPAYLYDSDSDYSLDGSARTM
ncbi:hypothetical protein ACLOJK_030989 [Asimina triloba]